MLLSVLLVGCEANDLLSYTGNNVSNLFIDTSITENSIDIQYFLGQNDIFVKYNEISHLFRNSILQFDIFQNPLMPNRFNSVAENWSTSITFDEIVRQISIDYYHLENLNMFNFNGIDFFLSIPITNVKLINNRESIDILQLINYRESPSSVISLSEVLEIFDEQVILMGGFMPESSWIIPYNGVTLIPFRPSLEERIESIIINYREATYLNAINFNGIDGTSTIDDVIMLFGEPDSENILVTDGWGRGIGMRGTLISYNYRDFEEFYNISFGFDSNNNVVSISIGLELY